MLLKRIVIPSLLIMGFYVNANSQKVENLHFEQTGNQIIIYYDLIGTQPDQTYDIQAFCSTDGGKTFGEQLKQVSGDLGSNITGGIGKKVIWDVLTEQKKLEGNILFEIQGKSSRLIDQDGNVYKTVKIGERIWMAENLKTTKLSDGTSIPLITKTTAWSNLSSLGYCWYNNNPAYKEIYGAMYNWYAVETGKLCPIGWHVPTDSEWHELILIVDPNSKLSPIGQGQNYFESEVGAIKLREPNTKYWLKFDSKTNNESGFSALPSGNRHIDGSFNGMGYAFQVWSATEYNVEYALPRFINGHQNIVLRQIAEKKSGYAVRCIKD